jgi:hypothetical protein
MVPSCSPCDCDDSCIRKSTCCPYKHFHFENSSAKKIQENVYLDKLPLSCVQPHLNTFPESDVQGYWFISSCPNGDPCHAKKKKNKQNKQICFLPHR